MTHRAVSIGFKVYSDVILHSLVVQVLHACHVVTHCIVQQARTSLGASRLNPNGLEVLGRGSIGVGGLSIVSIDDDNSNKMQPAQLRC